METFELKQSKEELIKKATTRKGIPKKMLYYILEETEMSLKELSGYINFSPRSIQPKKPNERLPFEPSEKTLLIARIYSKGFEVFGKKDKFIRWMENENFVLGGIKPKEYLYSYTGIELLLNEINAIDFGFVA
jgi:putative toxin-antitoxin system antitoxin component (TIGR02293 family)